MNPDNLIALHTEMDKRLYPHDQRDGEPPYTDELRGCIGVYERPIRNTTFGNMARQFMGEDNSFVYHAFKHGSEPAETADPIQTILDTHPLTFESVDTIVHLELHSMWRDRWDTILNYNSPDNERVHTLDIDVTVRDDLDTPDIDVPANTKFAIHYIDGQDMHHKTRLFGITHADSYEEAIRAFAGNYDALYCPANWEFEILAIKDEHRYNRDSFDERQPPENNEPGFDELLEQNGLDR